MRKTAKIYAKTQQNLSCNEEPDDTSDLYNTTDTLKQCSHFGHSFTTCDNFKFSPRNFEKTPELWHAEQCNGRGS